MGIFHEQTRIINRAPVNLTARFDGQDMTLHPGENLIPKMAVQFAKNQNPIMGTASPTDPSIAGGRYLIGEIGVDDPENCEMLSKDEWETHLGKPCRLDEQAMFDERYSNDPKARMVVHGQKRDARGHETSPTRSRSEAGIASAQLATFEAER